MSDLTEGGGDVKAEKDGYRPSQFHEVALADETELPPVTLFLSFQSQIEGMIEAGSRTGYLSPCV